MIVEFLLVAIGTILVYFLPGFVWSYLLLGQVNIADKSTQERFFRIIERIAVSFALSLVLIPLTVFLLNLLIDVGPSILDSLMISLIPIVVGALLLLVKKKKILRGILGKMKRVRKN
ncbi:MAG: hypothetical protein H5T41_06975 [Methanomassiliicoccales archaeon]|nr:hypothetical protein [Methanomassiliicoccales archaeon]